MEYVIEAKSICKNYNEHKILKGLNIHVPKGSIYGLVGRNGAGKTTFMRLICGMQTPSSGEFQIFGVSSNSKEILKARSRIGAIIESPSMYLSMNAVDNMKQQYRLLGIPSMDSIPEILNLVGLGDTGNKAAKHFSLGMKQRLGIAMALAGNPDCIILDEPMNGLDPEGIIEMRETIIKLNKEKDITFIISSHILDELSKVATDYGFINDGRLVEELSSKELMNRARKSTKVSVNDSKLFAGILENHGIEYTIESDRDACVYGEFDINNIMKDMLDKNSKLISLSATNESLESYFLELLGTSSKEETTNA